FNHDSGPQANATSTAQATASLDAFSVMANAESSLAIGEAYVMFNVTDPQDRPSVKVNIAYKGSALSAGADASIASWRLAIGAFFNQTGADERTLDRTLLPNLDYLILVNAGASGVGSGSAVAVINGGAAAAGPDSRAALAATAGSIVTPHPDNPDVVVH